MSRLALALALAVCVSADSDALSSVTGIKTALKDDLLAVTRFFTISRITSTVLITESDTTSIYPTCTVAATVGSCAPNAMGRSLNFEILSPSKPGEIEMTAAPGLARIDLPADYEEEETTEFGELVFSSQETSECFTPRERNLADFVTFRKTTTATTTLTTTVTDTLTTVSIMYDGCVPADALSTTVCV